MKPTIARCSLAAALLLPLASPAADGSWSNDASGVWSDASNWDAGLVATGTDATAYFTNAITAHRVVTNDLAGQALGHLTFDGGGFAWKLAGSPVALSQTSGASRVSVLSGVATVSALLTGGPGLVKDGPGRLDLAASETYTGPTIVSNGVMKLQVPEVPTALLKSALYWLDASDTNTITMDATNNVIVWADKTGNGRSFLQALTTNQPLFVSNAIGGLPAIRFNGVDQRLVYNTNTSPQVVFIVNRPLGYSNLNGIWGNSGDAGIRLASASAWQRPGDGNDFNNGADGAVFINGVTGNSFGASGTAHVLTEVRGSNHTKAYNNSILGGYYPNRWWNGEIGEVVVFGAKLNAMEQKIVERYLATKWIGASVTASPVDVLPVTTQVRLDAGAALDLNGGSHRIGSLADGAGAGTLTNSAAESAALTIGLDHAVATFSGNIGGPLDLTKAGFGRQTLAGTITYGGGTVVAGGTLGLASSNEASGTIGSSSGVLVNGGTLNIDVTGAFLGTNARPVILSAGLLTMSNGVHARIAGPLTLGGGALAGGTPDATAGNWSIESNVTVTASSGITASRTQLGVADGNVIDVTNGASLGVSGALEDPPGATGRVVKTGAGTLALSARNTYSGDTVIRAGKVKLQAANPPVPGVLYWLDASHPGLVIRDAGGNVNQWLDKSGNGRDFLPLTTNARPLLVANVLNGKPAIRFNGTSSQMIMTNATTPASTFIVTIPGATMGGNRGIWGRWDTDAGWRQGLGGWYGDRNNNDWPGPSGGVLYSNSVPGNGTNLPVVANAPILLGAIYTNTPFAFASTGIGRYTSVSGGGRYYQGDIAEMLVYPTALGDADRQAVEAYLMAKWFGSDGGTGSTNGILPAATVVRLAPAATLDLAGIVSQSIGALSDQDGGGGTVSNSVAALATLATGTGDGGAAFSGRIVDGAGAVALTKDGAGTQTLHGLSTCSGGTALSNGVLLVQGALAGTGTLTVTAGTLGGTGAIGGLVLQLGGTVAPGASSGTLTFLGNYAQGGDLAIEIAGTTPGAGHDQLIVGGQASLFATLTVTTNGYTPLAGDNFTILTASNGVNGTFALATLPPLSAPELGWKVDYHTNAVVLSVTSAPPAMTGYDLFAGQIPNAADRGYLNDPDGDGYANLLEYVTGGNPTNSDTVAQMKSARTNGVLALKFSRSITATDATLHVEGSYATTNDATWTGIATNLAGSWGGAPNVSETGGPDPLDVTVAETDPVATNRFLRLRVTRP